MGKKKTKIDNNLQANIIKNFVENTIKDLIQIGGDETLGKSKKICKRRILGEIMNMQTKSKIYDTLMIDKEKATEEIGILLLLDKLAEYKNECLYFYNKYKKDFSTFEKEFNQINGSFELENDYLAWKFAEDSKNHLISIKGEI